MDHPKLIFKSLKLTVNNWTKSKLILKFLILTLKNFRTFSGFKAGQVCTLWCSSIINYCLVSDIMES